MMKFHLRRILPLLLSLFLVCAAAQAFALETVEKDGKLYVAESGIWPGYLWDDWGYYYIFDDGEVGTGWFRDEDGQWRYAGSDGLITTSWAALLQGTKSVTIPEEVDSINIEDLSGLGMDSVLYVTPGSYGEAFARANAFPYDNGISHVVGTGITNENEKVQWIVDNYVTSGMSDLEKARVLHDWITRNTRYDLTYTHHDSYTLLVEGYGVCDAHSSAYEKLLAAAGVPVTSVSGDAGGSHAWNLVKLGDAWYHVDTTWDDPVKSTEEVAENPEPYFSGMEGYSYFVQTDQEMIRSHTWNSSFIPNNNTEGFMLVSGKIVYRDKAAGSLLTGWKTVLDVDYAYDTAALSLEETESYRRFHFGEDGSMQIGWQEIGGERYYFDKTGVMARGSTYIDGENYYFDQSGRLQTGLVWNDNKLIKLDENGRFVTGFQSDNGQSRYYSGPYGENTNSGDGRFYEDGAAYQLDGTNTVMTGLIRNENGISFFDENGKRTDGGWICTDRGWMYLWYDHPLTGGYYTLEKDGITGYFRFDEDGFLTDYYDSDWNETELFAFPEAEEHVHLQEIMPGKDATLTEPGLTRGVRCAYCGKILSPQTEIPAFSQVARFVERCYDVILDREADPSGLEDWTEKLESQYLAASNIVSGFVNSQEFDSKPQTNEEKVEIMYRTMLGRSSDPAGKEYWVSVLESGLSINAVAAGFAGSQEFMGICGEYGIDNGIYELEARDLNAGVTGFVRRCYEQALDREAETAGLNYWCEELLSLDRTPQEVAHGFIASPEMQSRGQTDEEFVRTMYRLYLGREPDPDGFAYWVGRLESDADRNAIEAGFADSAEFAGIVAGYGLN